MTWASRRTHFLGGCKFPPKKKERPWCRRGEEMKGRSRGGGENTNSHTDSPKVLVPLHLAEQRYFVKQICMPLFCRWSRIFNFNEQTEVMTQKWIGFPAVCCLQLVS